MTVGELKKQLDLSLEMGVLEESDTVALMDEDSHTTLDFVYRVFMPSVTFESQQDKKIRGSKFSLMFAR